MENQQELDPEYIACNHDIVSLSSRSFHEQLGFLRLTEKDLVGKVLNLGSEENEILAREAQTLGIDVVSVNPLLSSAGRRENRNRFISNLQSGKIRPELSGTKTEVVAALSGRLPFKDDSFDTVISVYAIPYWLPPDLNVLSNTFTEINRVIRPGGKAYIYPTTISAEEEASGKLLDNDTVRKSLELCDINFHFDPDSKLASDNPVLIITK